jgi:hypothetical protein
VSQLSHLLASLKEEGKRSRERSLPLRERCPTGQRGAPRAQTAITDLQIQRRLPRLFFLRRFLESRRVNDRQPWYFAETQNAFDGQNLDARNAPMVSLDKPRRRLGN